MVSCHWQHAPFPVALARSYAADWYYVDADTDDSRMVYRQLICFKTDSMARICSESQ